MFENLSIGLDIATAASVIAAATAFIWNSGLSKKNERIEREKELIVKRNERKIEIIKAQVFKVADKILDETAPIIKEVTKMLNQSNEGNMVQDLNSWRDLILQLPNSFMRLIPLSEVYGEKKLFKNLKSGYTKELNEFILDFHEVIESGERWDFDSTMNKPTEITLKYIALLYQETEDYFENL